MLPQLVGIELPECIVSILSYAFYGCSNLSYIGIPENCESIQEDAFTDLPSLRKLKIPDNVKNVSPKMLTGCFNLEKIECSVLDCVDGFIISEGGTRLVRYSRNKEIINIPPGIKIIEEKAFYNSSIEKVIMPEGLKKIMPSAFSYCKNLKNADIPTSVEEIGEDAFYCCDRRFYSHIHLMNSDELVKNALENIIKYKDFFFSFEDLISGKYLKYEFDFSNDEEEEEDEEWLREHEGEIFGEALNGDCTYID